MTEHPVIEHAAPTGPGHSAPVATRIAALLKQRYGYSADVPNAFDDELGVMTGPESEPLDGLIETILSQQSTVAVTQRMSIALRTAYPLWDRARRDGPEAIQRVLESASGNLARTKARYIHGVLHRLHDERGELTLHFLRTWTREDARTYLLSFTGVGPKTADCVLLFNLRLPAMPVDTHVHRLTRRLGLVPDDAPPDASRDWLETHLTPTWQTHYEFHLNTIDHGRITCRARAPRCGTCIVSSYCPSWSAQIHDVDGDPEGGPSAHPAGNTPAHPSSSGTKKSNTTRLRS